MIRWLFFLVVGFSLTVLPVTGCEWAGRVTGKTVKGVERGVKKAADKVDHGVKKFEKGYQGGRK